VIYEGLRMRSPAPGLYPKVVPQGGDVIKGKFIPAGTAIGMNTSALLRSTSLFGDDAEIFRPERFTEASEATRAEMERNVEMVFGHGRYMCAGKPVAMMELNKVYFEVSTGAKPAGWRNPSYQHKLTSQLSCYGILTSSWLMPPNHGTHGVILYSWTKTCGSRSPKREARSLVLLWKYMKASV
jgi:hypothetical protein